jgi:hypothetical protein
MTKIDFLSWNDRVNPEKPVEVVKDLDIHLIYLTTSYI